MKLEKINWQNLSSQKMVVPHPVMLMEGGMIKVIKLGAREGLAHSYYEVIFDRNYVLHWIREKLLKNLEMPKEQIVSLVQEALKEN